MTPAHRVRGRDDVGEREVGLPPAMEDFAAAAWITLPFAAYILLLGVVAPFGDAQWSRGDPILHLVPRPIVGWGAPALGGLAAVVWALVSRPSLRTLGGAARGAGVGAVVAAAGVLALRLIHGRELPGFIPAEESAAPGPLLSMCAGYVEEVVCRLGVLAVAWRLSSRRLPRTVAVVLSAAASALTFAALHRWGEVEPSNVYFATRLLLPGFGFGVAALVLRPAYVVSGHCSAHLLLPVLFATAT